MISALNRMAWSWLSMSVQSPLEKVAKHIVGYAPDEGYDFVMGSVGH